jgi:1L-myo-inositol 1-phosphate cytidylyltransferase / CDP-L-myo-inositol myo-inositolphosphotransferase
MRTGPGGPSSRYLSATSPDGDREEDAVVVRVPAARPRVGVVLAAGRSERLSRLTRGRSKALVQLGGVPLVERAVRTLQHAGCTRVVVIVGYQGEQVGAAARLASGDVEVVHADQWEAGNGASLAAAEEAVRGEELFVVLCGDHAFSKRALDPLLDARAPAVLVDPDPDAQTWCEGTRVNVRGDRAVAFGKDLDDPAIDCGVFVLPQRVFSAQRAAAVDGDHSLAGAVTGLTRQAPLRVVPLDDRSWWQDIDTPEDLRLAKTRVRRSLGKPNDGPVSTYINRPISTRISMAIAPFRPAPDLVTMFTLLVGLWAAWSLSAGRAVVGALLAQTVSVLDGVDGETARLQDRSSERGAFLDDLCDRMVDAALVAGLWLWFWDDPGRTFRVMIILMAMVGWGAIALAIKDPVTERFEFAADERPPLLVLLGGRDARWLLVAVVCLFDQPAAAFTLAGLAYCSGGIYRLVLMHKRSKRRAPSRLPAPDGIGHGAERDLEEIG